MAETVEDAERTGTEAFLTAFWGPVWASPDFCTILHFIGTQSTGDAGSGRYPRGIHERKICLRALVTGIAGFAGSVLADYLLRQADVEVHGVIHRTDLRIQHLHDRLHLHRMSDDWQALKQDVANFLDRFKHGSPDLLRYVGLLPN